MANSEGVGRDNGTDPAIALLRGFLTPYKRSLWVAGESFGQQPLPLPHYYLSNRVDVAAVLAESAAEGALSDFDFEDLPVCERVLYRIGKEKRQNRHIIRAALRYLPENGELILCGLKQEGIKSLAQETAKLIGSDARARKQGNVYTIQLQRSAVAPEPYSEYLAWQVFEVDGLGSVSSKPGIFGWDQVDSGSALLASHFEAELPPKSRVLDLGCGWGFLSLHAAGRDTQKLVAVDNNVAAVAACRKNFDKHGISAEVRLADAARGIGGGGSERFDVVLCNPPFHRGFSTSNDLIQQFVDTAANVLDAQGSALFVVNSFVPLDRVAQGRFGVVDCLEETDGFSVFLLQEPRRPA